MLGHASVKQTADTYTHVSPTMHREAAVRLNDFLSEHLKRAPIVMAMWWIPHFIRAAENRVEGSTCKCLQRRS